MAVYFPDPLPDTGDAEMAGMFGHRVKAGARITHDKLEFSGRALA